MQPISVLECLSNTPRPVHPVPHTRYESIWYRKYAARKGRHFTTQATSHPRRSTFAIQNSHTFAYVRITEHVQANILSLELISGEGISKDRCNVLINGSGVVNKWKCEITIRTYT